MQIGLRQFSHECGATIKIRQHHAAGVVNGYADVFAHLGAVLVDEFGMFWQEVQARLKHGIDPGLERQSLSF